MKDYKKPKVQNSSLLSLRVDFALFLSSGWIMETNFPKEILFTLFPLPSVSYIFVCSLENTSEKGNPTSFTGHK